MEEVVDVVSIDDVRVGTATRERVHETGVWHRGIHVLVFNARGDLLLQRRSAKKGKSPRALDLSVSEHAKEGETFEEAAARGLKEELGVEGLQLERILKFRMAYGPRDNMISTIYRSRFSGKVRLDPSEVEEIVPTNLESVRALVVGEPAELTPWARQILRWYFHLPSMVEEMR